MKVLIADDEITSRIVLEETLQEWGYKTQSAGDGLEAFKLMQDERAPRLLILDWMMPGMDGTELCRRLRESNQSQYVYIILLTSKNEKKDVILGMDSGADAFLTKPVDFDELKSRLAAEKRILAHQSRITTSALDKPTKLLPAIAVSVCESVIELPARLQEKLTDLSKDSILGLVPRKRVGSNVLPILGKMLLLRKLGEGGMGAVYHGYNPRMQKEVAVKVLSTSRFRDRADSTARFYREAQIASLVKSDHLVAVTDVDQEQGVIYLVMELVNGISAVDYLEQEIRANRNGLAESTALDICIAAAKGLAAAHANGIVHRDVKPDNILIPYDSEKGEQFKNAKIADLGIARHETNSEGLTETNVALGTAGFMSPEQICDAKHAGKAADVFGLGATLYSLLTARAPFTGPSSFVIFANTINKPHMPIAGWRPDVSSGTVSIIETCLAKQSSERYLDCSALLEDLEYCRNMLDLTFRPKDATTEAVNAFGVPKSVKVHSGVAAPTK
jgi:serine/threonine-protein kinase